MNAPPRRPPNNSVRQPLHFDEIGGFGSVISCGCVVDAWGQFGGSAGPCELLVGSVQQGQTLQGDGSVCARVWTPPVWACCAVACGLSQTCARATHACLHVHHRHWQSMPQSLLCLSQKPLW